MAKKQAYCFQTICSGASSPDTKKVRTLNLYATILPQQVVLIEISMTFRKQKCKGRTNTSRDLPQMKEPGGAKTVPYIINVSQQETRI